MNREKSYKSGKIVLISTKYISLMIFFTLIVIRKKCGSSFRIDVIKRFI